jgi:DNA-binding transcriptional regulator LsrR (DeoR family)
MAKEATDLSTELRSIKMLMILQLLRQGVKQGQIAAILGISEPTMSRMLPKGIARGVLKNTSSSATEGSE